MINEMNEMIDFFFNKRITTHIDTLDGGFFNGLITEVHETFLVLNDRMLGETPIPFSTIRIIQRFRGRE